MNSKSPKHDDPSRIQNYYLSGEHAFVTSRSEKKIDQLTQSIVDLLPESSVQVLDCRETLRINDFVGQVVNRLNRLLAAIGRDPAIDPRSLNSAIKHAAQAFEQENSQGFLLVKHVGPILDQQKTFEIEAAFREVMQFYSSIAIMWLGDQECMRRIAQDDRPFYLSFLRFNI